MCACRSPANRSLGRGTAPETNGASRIRSPAVRYRRGTSAIAADRPASELPWSVDVGAVLDGHDVDPAVLVVDTVDHPIIAPAGAVQPVEPEPERLADPVRVGGQ